MATIRGSQFECPSPLRGRSARVIRPPAIGARLIDVDSSSLAGIPDAEIVRIKDFLAVAARGGRLPFCIRFRASKAPASGPRGIVSFVLSGQSQSWRGNMEGDPNTIGFMGGESDQWTPYLFRDHGFRVKHQGCVSGRAGVDVRLHVAIDSVMFSGAAAGPE